MAKAYEFAATQQSEVEFNQDRAFKEADKDTYANWLSEQFVDA